MKKYQLNFGICVAISGLEKLKMKFRCLNIIRTQTTRVANFMKKECQNNIKEQTLQAQNFFFCFLSEMTFKVNAMKKKTSKY